MSWKNMMRFVSGMMVTGLEEQRFFNPWSVINYFSNECEPRAFWQSTGNNDIIGENFYHGFMLGLCAVLLGLFVTSNRESGDGRSDIQLKPKNKALPGIIIEIKTEKNCTDMELRKKSEVALKQINEKKYDTEMLAQMRLV